MKLDIFNHIFPRAFYNRLLEVAPNGKLYNIEFDQIKNVKGSGM